MKKSFITSGLGSTKYLTQCESKLCDNFERIFKKNDLKKQQQLTAKKHAKITVGIDMGRKLHKQSCLL